MAENIKRHITHIKSKVVENGSPKLPTSSQIQEGEIAVNYAKGYETLSVKNESGTVVTFSSDNYYSEKKLGSGFTGSNSGKTVTEVIEENEETVAAAITDIESRMAEKAALASLSNTVNDLVYFKSNHQHYWANLLTSSSANYITEPEIKSVKINGSTTNAASTNNCHIQYDTTNKCLKFIFN